MTRALIRVRTRESGGEIRAQIHRRGIVSSPVPDSFVTGGGVVIGSRQAPGSMSATRSGRHGFWLFAPLTATDSLIFGPSFSADTTAMRLGGSAVDVLQVCRIEGDQFIQHPPPNVVLRLTVESIVDHCVWTIEFQTIAPSAAKFQRTQNAIDNPSSFSTPSHRAGPSEQTIRLPAIVGHTGNLRSPSIRSNRLAYSLGCCCTEQV
jgi:hypothetical protein